MRSGRFVLVLAAICSIYAACAPRSIKCPRLVRPPQFVLMDTSEGPITLELDPDRAPVTVDNFLSHADRGDYNGTIFHRVVQNFVIQGGGWTPDLVERAALDKEHGRPDTPIVNEWRNGLKNTRGAIAMARDEGPDTATREFYINVADNAKLDTARQRTGNAGYAVFGRVIAGMDVVDRISNIPTAPRAVAGVTDGSMENVPVNPVVIRKVERISGAQARPAR